MLKRFLSLSFVIILVLCFSLSVYAAVAYQPIGAQDDNTTLVFDVAFSPGYYRGIMTRGDSVVAESDWFYAPFEIYYEMDDVSASQCPVTLYFKDGTGDFFPGIVFIATDGKQSIFQYSIDGAKVALCGIDDVIFTLEYQESMSVSLEDAVTDAIQYPISWIGTVVDSLMTGLLTPLLLLLAVPIAISALFFGIKAIRRTTWGT